MRRFTWVALIALGAAMLAVGPAGADDDGGAKTWHVTITNLTPAGGGSPPGAQPLSPPVVAVHSGRADVWSVGEIARHGVVAVAEDANNPVLERLSRRVRRAYATHLQRGKRLLDRDRLREISWLVDVQSPKARDAVGEEL
jgi:hypothetical protein